MLQRIAHIQTHRWLSYITLIFAIILRIICYLYNRSLFLDEALLAINMIEKDWYGILGVLDLNQSAPPGFLLVSKFFIETSGTHEYVLRFFPFVLGILSCILMFQLVQKINPRLTPIMMIWFATADILIRFGTEFKQYSGDLFLTLLLLIIAVHLLQKATLRYIIYWAFASIIAVWFSHASVFAIAGFGFTIMLVLFRKRQWKFLVWFMIACGSALLSFAVAYLSFYHSTDSNTNLSTALELFWVNDFFRPNWRWGLRLPVIFFSHISGIRRYPLILLTMFGFIAGLWNTPKRYLILFLSPVPVMLLASYLNYYPIFQRFLLFSLPLIMFIIAFGWLDVYDKLAAQGKHLQHITFIFICIMFISGLDIRQETTQLRQTLTIIQDISVNEPEIYVSPRVQYVTDYYQYSIPVHIRSIEFDTIPVSDTPIWLIVDELESGIHESLSNTTGREPDFNPPGLIVYCIDGNEQICPAGENFSNRTR